eukprot:symbB.v1.2.022102.t1/scaffold1945.1/size95439/1
MAERSTQLTSPQEQRARSETPRATPRKGRDWVPEVAFRTTKSISAGDGALGGGKRTGLVLHRGVAVNLKKERDSLKRFCINTHKMAPEVMELLHGKQGKFLPHSDQPGQRHVHPEIAQKPQGRSGSAISTRSTSREEGASKVTGHERQISPSRRVDHSFAFWKINTEEAVVTRDGRSPSQSDRSIGSRSRSRTPVDDAPLTPKIGSDNRQAKGGRNTSLMSRDPLRRHDKWGDVDESSAEPDKGFGPCIWNIEQNRTLKTGPSDGSKTPLEILTKTKEKRGDSNAAGWRDVVKVHFIEEGGAKREKIELANEYKWITLNEYYGHVTNMAKGMAAAGVEPKARVVIFAETQLNWMVAAFATWCLNGQVVTIYATLGEEGASHGFNETQASTAVVDSKLLKTLLKVLPKCKSIKRIITLTPPDDAVAKQLKEAGVDVQTIDECIETGAKSEKELCNPTPEDIAVIMYTSGTTGTPKGVMLTHANLTAISAGAGDAFDGMVVAGDVYLAYLPLAHIMEMAAEVALLGLGIALGYGSPHTLTDTGVKLKRPESSGDAIVLQPHFMVFAPAVLDKVYKGILAKREGAGYVGQTLFDWGLASGERSFSRGGIGANFVYDKLVFKKVQNLMGGRLKAAVTGSAPLSPEIQKFIQTVLHVPVRQGYGLTETCAGSVIQPWSDNTTGSVGVGSGPSVSQGYFISEYAPNEELKTKNEDFFLRPRFEKPP